MAEATFVLNGDQVHLTSDQVIRAVWGMVPDAIQTWSVIVNDTAYPVKQVFRQAIGRADFTSHRAADVLKRLGFTVSDGGVPVGPSDAAAGTDDESDEPLADKTRLAALNAAITYASTRPNLEPDEVIATAEMFDAWLRNRKVDVTPDIWQAVSDLEGQQIDMVQPGKHFTIDAVAERAVTITIGSTRNQRKIERHKIERAWALKQRGERLRPTDVRAAGISQVNPAYVAAIVNAISVDF